MAKKDMHVWQQYNYSYIQVALVLACQKGSCSHHSSRFRIIQIHDLLLRDPRFVNLVEWMLWIIEKMHDVLLFPDSNFHNNWKKITGYGNCLFVFLWFRYWSSVFFG